MLAADSETADRLSDPGSLDPLGRLLRQEPGADAAPGLEILNADNAGRYSTLPSAMRSPSISRTASAPTSATA